LELQPRLTIASLRRAMLLCQRRRYEEATADLQSALASSDPAFQAPIQKALNQLARHEQAAALATLVEALEPEGPDKPAAKR
jgi:Tfp pilus assembly protein PilF